MGGISNFAIEKAFKKINDPDLLDNFVVVFPSNYMNKLHWWSILDIDADVR